MSFVKIPRRTARLAVSNQKRKPKKKPAWDDTNQDLTVYKASPDEIVRRKLAHMSKNMDLVQAEKLHKKIGNAKRTPNQMKQMPLLREVLYDQNQLQDVLAKSDQAMAVVRDLFGDDPKRYRGLPNVTAAPHQLYLDGSLPMGTHIDGPSKLDILSDSVMDKSALNEVEHHDTDDEDENEGTLQYKPLLDFGRFRKFLEAEQERAKQEDDVEKEKDAQRMAKLLEAEMAELGIQSPQDMGPGIPVTSLDDGSFIEEQTPATTPKLKAMNDTGKVNRVRSRLGQSDPDQPQHANSVLENKNNSSLGGTFQIDDLRQVLDGLERNLAAYERQTGRVHSTRSAPPETFSGYTMSLVSAVNKLTVYLKESELRLHAETTLREQLTEDVDQLKGIVEHLTTDIVVMQEEYTSQQDEFYKYRLISQQEIHNIKAALTSQGVPVIQAQQQLNGSATTTAPFPPAAKTTIGPYPIQGSHPQGGQGTQQGLQPQQQPKQQQVQLHNSHHHQPTQSYQIPPQQQQLQRREQQIPPQHQQQQERHSPKDPQHQHGPSPRPEMSNLTTQELQMLMLQQMMLGQGAQTQMQAAASDLHSQGNLTGDSGILEQHPLSSSLTSQGTLTSQGKVKASSAISGQPVPNHPPQTQPVSTLPARLLTPPRQSNSPQALGKTFRSNVGTSGNSLSTMIEMFREEGLLDHLRNVAHSQQIAAQNGGAQQTHQNHGKFRPIAEDHSQSASPEPQPQYFSHPESAASSSQQGGGQMQQAQQKRANTSVASSHSVGPGERLEMNRELFARQVEELNRQHAEAEGKLEKLRQQHYSDVDAMSTEVATPNHVSPSISPIPAGSETDTAVTVSDNSPVNFTREHNGHKSRSTGGKGITMALPSMELLNWSDTSTPTLSTSKSVSRCDSNSPVPVMTISPSGNDNTPFKDNQKVHPQSAFFALSTHVS